MPFSPEELLARSIVITRRATGTDLPIIPTITLGQMEIDILSREVRTGTSVIHLSGIEQSLLYLLASRGGRVVTRDEILDAIWGTDFVAESNIVDRHIRSLRIKLQNDYRHPRFIATVPGRGYRFIPTFSNQGWIGEGRPGRQAAGLIKRTCRRTRESATARTTLFAPLATRSGWGVLQGQPRNCGVMIAIAPKSSWSRTGLRRKANGWAIPWAEASDPPDTMRTGRSACRSRRCVARSSPDMPGI